MSGMVKELKVAVPQSSEVGFCRVIVNLYSVLVTACSGRLTLKVISTVKASNVVSCVSIFISLVSMSAVIKDVMS